MVLVFEIDEHRYGVDTRIVREVVRAVLPARLPEAPAVVAGVINARGSVVPLIDLRVRFGLRRGPVRASDVFVIVRSEARELAFIADGVHALLRVPESRIESARVSLPDAQHVAGAIALPDGVLLVCDVERFLDDVESAALDGALARHGSAGA